MASHHRALLLLPILSLSLALFATETSANPVKRFSFEQFKNFVAPFFNNNNNNNGNNNENNEQGQQGSGGDGSAGALALLIQQFIKSMQGEDGGDKSTFQKILMLIAPFLQNNNGQGGSTGNQLAQMIVQYFTKGGGGGGGNNNNNYGENESVTNNENQSNGGNNGGGGGGSTLDGLEQLIAPYLPADEKAKEQIGEQFAQKLIQVFKG